MSEHGRRDIDETKGSRRTLRRRTVVCLNVRALWDRLKLLNRSQGWLARETGISPGYLSMLINQERAPSGRVRRRMQRALGADDFRELFSMEEPHDE